MTLGAYRRSNAAETARDLERVLTYFPALRERYSAQAVQLSGGQQQMLAVARGLMSAPRIMLLDEPSIGLAPLMVQTIGSIIQEISRSGVDILLVEQNSRMALQLSAYGYIIDNGKLSSEGAAVDLLNDDVVRRTYLGL